jgi:hypothetical protein
MLFSFLFITAEHKAILYPSRYTSQKSRSSTPATYTFKFSTGDVATGGYLLINKVWERKKINI